MMSRRNLLILSVLVLLAASAAAYAWQQRQAAERLAQAAVRQEPIGRGTIVATVSATGYLASQQQVNLYFSTASPLPVADINIVRGQAVRQGEVLARLDDAELALAVAQAETALEGAELNLALMHAPARAEDVALAEANLRVVQAQVYAASQGNSPETIEIARLNLLLTQTTLNQTHKAMELLAEQGSLGWYAKRALEPQAEQQVEDARVADELYHAAQTSPGSGDTAAALAALEQAQVALDRLKNGARSEDLEIAQLRVDQAQAALELAQLNLSHAQIVAPFDAVVVAVNARPGELAASAVPAIVLADISSLYLEVAVDEVDVARVAPGQPVTVTLDALPNALLAGRVEKIAPAATNTIGVVSYGVRLRLDPTQAQIREGMTATAEIVVAEARDVVLAPNWAIRRDRDSGLAYAAVLRNGQIEDVAVMLGLRNETYSQIITGLAAGDVVAVDTTREQFRLLGGEQ